MEMQETDKKWLLSGEACLVELTAKLVSSVVGTTRTQKTSEKQARLTTLWERYGCDDITLSEFRFEAWEYDP